MNRKLKNLIVLESNVKIYVPGTIEINKTFDNTEIVNRALSILSSYFGGSTSYAAVGCWISQNIGLIKENVTICESYCKETDLKKHIDSIIEFCESLKTELNQEAISLEINNKLYFV
jgi:pyruvoyl-dependent arginine decarboxylase (PvlArgDC)